MSKRVAERLIQVGAIALAGDGDFRTRHVPTAHGVRGADDLGSSAPFW